MLDEIVENPDLNRRKFLKLGLAALAAAAIGGMPINPAYAAGDNSTTVEQTQNLETLVYKRITYRQLEENSKIYVPLGATPEEQAKDAFHPWTAKAVKSELNQTSFRNNPIDEVRYTITPTEYMERIKDTYKIAAKNNGKGAPKTKEEAEKLIEKYGLPLYLVGIMGKVRETDGKTIIVPEKVKRPGFNIGVILEEPSEEGFPFLTLTIPYSTTQEKVLEKQVTLQKAGELLYYIEDDKKAYEEGGPQEIPIYVGVGPLDYYGINGRFYETLIPLVVEKIVEENGKRIAYITPLPATIKERTNTY